jgi:hypothetical protein
VKGASEAGTVSKVTETTRGAEATTAVAEPGTTLARRLGIPDELTDTGMTEVKNVKRLGFTHQIQDFMYYAARTGRSFNLVVRKNTRLTKELEDIIGMTSSPIRLLRSLPSR